MHIYSVNNTAFGAKIKLDKNIANDLLYSGTISSIGSSAIGSGIASSAPVLDPVHHIHSAAKVVDGAFALTGLGFGGVASSCFKLSLEFLKSALSKMKAKIPS